MMVDAGKQAIVAPSAEVAYPCGEARGISACGFLVTTQGVRRSAERCQAPMVPSTVLKVLASEVMRAVATTVRTAASPLADHMAR